MLSTLATDALRRSQLYRRHMAMDATFTTLGDSVVVSHYASEDETKQAQHLGLADLSTLPRTGFKGLGTPDWARTERYCNLMAHWSRVYPRANYCLPVI